MICPKCGHRHTASQDGREAVITHHEVFEAYVLAAEGHFSVGVDACEATALMRTLLARPSTYDEREATT